MLRTILFSVTIGIAANAFATDTLILENGDRITGTLVGNQDGVITFNSPLLGNISVSAEQATVQVDPGPTEAGTEVVAAAAAADVPPASPTTTEEKQKEVDAVTAAIKNAQNWVDSYTPEGWTGKFATGLSYIETDSETLGLNITLDGEKDAAPNHYAFNLFYNYNKQTDSAGVETKNLDKYGAAFGYDRDINDLMFFSSELSYLRDMVKDIRHQADLDLGIGFRVINEEDMELNIIPAYTLQYKDALGVSQKWYNLATLKEDFMYRFSEIVRFEQSASVSVAPEDTNDYQYAFKAALISKLAEWVEASISYELTFDNTVGTGGNRQEQQLIFGLGVPY